MTPEDLATLAFPSDLRFHPDGRRLAFVVSRLDLEGDAWRRRVWLADGEAVRPFTAGPDDTSPRWSPDGSSLAVLRSQGPGQPRQVVVVPVDGGEGRTVTSFELGVEAVEWSPDGRQLAVRALCWEEGWEGLSPEERERRPRRIARFPYRHDLKGVMWDRRRHLLLVDAQGEEPPRDLTPQEAEVDAFAWAPDGSRLAVLWDRDPRGGVTGGTQVWEVPVDGSPPRQAAERGLWYLPGYRPDGVLHLIGCPGVELPANYTLWRVEEDGHLTDLTGHLDRSSVSTVAGAPLLHWVGNMAYVSWEDSGSMGVVRVHPDGTCDHLVSERRVVSGFSPDPSGERLAFSWSTPQHPGVVSMMNNHGEQVLTDLNPEAAPRLGLVEPHHLRVVSDGVEVDAWVYLPPGDEQVPVLVNIHGGPASQYTWGFFDEFQVYAGAGFGVVAANPRGSSGRGEEFLRAVVGEGWGRVDLDDLNAVVEEALHRHPRLDAARMGIMGGSYGGFLTAWATAHDDRYGSAVVERGLLSFPSFAGTSDIGPTFPRAYTGFDYPDGWDRWWELSPLAVAHRVTTPTLVLHSENDYRCPIEQAEQYFLALFRNGVETEMLRFPGEGHEMSRSGRPRHRVERFKAILDWHRRHLG